MLIPELIPTITAMTEEEYERKPHSVENFVGRIQIDIMGVETGFSGPKLNPSVLPKILSLREKYPSLPIAGAGASSFKTRRPSLTLAPANWSGLSPF